MKNVILITKDAQAKSYFPVYGNKYWKTPNIDELANKGTIFNKHYTAAVSTAMSFTSILYGIYPFETNRKRYEQVKPLNIESIFDKFEMLGYIPIMAWDSSYLGFANKYLGPLGKNVIVENLDIIPHHKPHIFGEFDCLTFSEEKEKNALIKIEKMFAKHSVHEKPIFMWFHLPHVIDGRNSYASDVDVFDKIIGLARKYFKDEEISISSDHGNMDGWNNKYGYGFDLHENVIQVPLITPRVKSGEAEINFKTSHIDLFEMLKDNVALEREIIISDTAYYVQPNRKITIIKDNYKLIFDKRTKRFSLFDIQWDQYERHNLFYPDFYDVDRLRWYSINQRFFYPNWEESQKAKKILLEKFKEVYRKGKRLEEVTQKIKESFKKIYIHLFIKNKTKRKRKKK